MKIAFLIFEKITALDAVGPYEVLSRLPGAELTFVAAEAGEKRTDTGALALTADVAIDDYAEADVLLIPGGEGNRPRLENEHILEWVRAIDRTTSWTTSVCTGSLVLAAAGLLGGVPATTHWAYLDRLGELGADPIAERVVTSGKYMTAAGVSAGIDMALTLVGEIAGEDVAKAIQLGIEYDPQPPFDSGSPRTASPELVGAIRDLV
jgi:transcriptional regulator GlxA family with amidase domain